MLKNKKDTLLTDLLGVLGVVIFILVWWIVSLIIHERQLILPNPYDAFKELGILIKQKYTYLCIGYTLLRSTLGFLIALVFASIFGVFAGLYKGFKKVMAPIITSLKAIPTVSFMFLFFAMIGYSNAPILVVCFICFPSLYDSVVGGIENINPTIINATRLESRSWLKKVSKVYFPLAFSYIAVGMASSFGLALKVEIMSEVVSGTTSYGIGSAIKAAQNGAVMGPIFGWTLISVILLLIITFIIRILKNRLLDR